MLAGTALLVVMLGAGPQAAVAQDQEASVSSSSPLIRLTFGGQLQADRKSVV